VSEVEKKGQQTAPFPFSLPRGKEKGKKKRREWATMSRGFPGTIRGGGGRGQRAFPLPKARGGKKGSKGKKGKKKGSKKKKRGFSQEKNESHGPQRGGAGGGGALFFPSASLQGGKKKGGEKVSPFFRLLFLSGKKGDPLPCLKQKEKKLLRGGRKSNWGSLLPPVLPPSGGGRGKKGTSPPMTRA